MRKMKLGITLCIFNIHGAENSSMQSSLVNITSSHTKFKNYRYDTKVYITRNGLNKIRNTINNTVNSLEFLNNSDRFILGRHSTTKNINIRPYAVM